MTGIGTSARMLLAALALLAFAAPTRASQPAPAAPTPVPIDLDMSLGPPRAPVTVIAYVAVTCPHCAQYQRDVFPAFRRRYIDTGQVRYVLREATVHPSWDIAGYLLARCAGPDNYFKVVDGLLGGMDELVRTRDFRTILYRVAGSVGLSRARASACMTDQRRADQMMLRVRREFGEYHVDHTPTFVVNGQKLALAGPVDLATLDRAIQPLLKQRH
jgi:protein-disulfide isomerase